MYRLIFYAVILILFARSVSKLWAGVREGLGHERPSRRRVPERGVQMARDPVCGTFVIPEQAIVLTTGSQRLYFCSTECRDKYRSRPESSHEPAHGRTA